MRTSHDSMGGYEWSMLLLRLAQTRRVNARMAALSIFQVALKVIADGELSRSDIRHPIAVFVVPDLPKWFSFQCITSGQQNHHTMLAC